ncbi:MAG: hypothetical protein SPI53_05075 [Erysipelotrichaceae bacterium]|nr:hypothetical protein [Erysipelotrichaceae bacterium]
MTKNVERELEGMTIEELREVNKEVLHALEKAYEVKEDLEDLLVRVTYLVITKEGKRRFEEIKKLGREEALNEFQRIEQTQKG